MGFKIDFIFQCFQQLHVLDRHHGDDLFTPAGKRNPLLTESRPVDDL
jgi:hypothetical protein